MSGSLSHKRNIAHEFSGRATGLPMSQKHARAFAIVIAFIR